MSLNVKNRNRAFWRYEIVYRIILVDDEIWALRGLSNVINWEQAGFTVIASFTDPTEAIKQIRILKPDAIFTDVRMPQLSGLELMRLALDEGLAYEFVIVSAYSDFIAAKTALRYGAFDYVLKPFDPEDIENLALRLYKRLSVKMKPLSNDIIGIDLLINNGGSSWLNQLKIRSFCYVIISDSVNYKWFIDKNVEWQSALFEKGYRIYLLTSEQRIETLFIAWNKAAEMKNINIGISIYRTSFDNIASMIFEAEQCLRHKIYFSINQAVSSIQIYISKNFMNNICLHDLAKELFLTETYICELFKKNTRLTISSYIMYIRLNEAAYLLKKSDLSLQEISEKVGYSDYNYFGRIFKQHFYISPKIYREKNKHGYPLD